MEDYFRCVKEEMELRDELRLIDEVRRRPVIYSKKLRFHNSKTRRNEAWVEVAEAMQLNEVDCRKKWRSLRDCFVRDGGCDGAPNTPTLRKYFTAMEFIKEHVKRKTTSARPKQNTGSRPSSPTVIYENGDFDYADETTQYNDDSIYEENAEDNVKVYDIKSIDLSYSPTTESRIDYANETGGGIVTPIPTEAADVASTSSAAAAAAAAMTASASGRSTLKLIHELQKHEVLYTRSSGGLNYRHERNKSWEQIASALQMDVYESKYRWKTLRDRYVKECGIIEPGVASTWEFYNHMEFIRGHIRPKTTTTTSARQKIESADNYQIFALRDIDEPHFNSSLLDVDAKPGHDFEASSNSNANDAAAAQQQQQQLSCTAATNETSSSFHFDYSQENDSGSEIDLTQTSGSSPNAGIATANASTANAACASTSNAACPSTFNAAANASSSCVHPMELSAADNAAFSSFLQNVEEMTARRLHHAAFKLNKHQAFFNLAAEKLDQLSSDDQEEAQMFFLSYLHKKLRQNKKRRK